jgi:thioesterase domain-containing protein/acyl carrier protein
MTEQLVQIWQRLLEKSPIHVEDNFFDLGGDSLLAVELFNAIAKECGRELPPVTIYQAPTISALAELLNGAAPPRLPSLVTLKAGTGYPPIFLAHGLGGSAMDFFQLVRCMRLPNPIHGLQARGADGVDEPFDRIEDMARFHLGTIRELQEHGPYLLIGFSFGGLVTLEMARLLIENGEKVALLALLESYPHTRYVSMFQRLRVLARVARNHAATVKGLRFREAVSYIFRPSERLAHFSRTATGRAGRRPSISLWFTPAMQQVRGSAYRALQRYRPHFYKGKIRFVRAQIPTEFPDDPRAVWGSLAGEFEVETVPGDHLGILTTHFESLGAVLSRYIEESATQK